MADESLHLAELSFDASQPAPAAVRQTEAFLQAQGLWHVFSRNSPATGCRDAAARRWRLGKQGIPLYDELKTLCFAASLPEGVRPVLLHARAHVRIDVAAAGALLGALAPLQRLAAADLEALHGIGYGTVNPFSHPLDFIHVFDRDLTRRYTAPHTMMTNAGDRTWAVEFEPQQLMAALRHAGALVLLGDLQQRRQVSPALPSFGILTGNGPESGMALWRHLNSRIFDRLQADGRLHGDLSYPRVVVHSLPEMGLSMELVQRQEQVWQVLQEGVTTLCQAGISHLALACNTTPYFTERIRAVCQPFGTAFLPIHEPVLRLIRQQALDELTLLAIPVVAEMGNYSAYRPLRQLGVQPADTKAMTALQELAYIVKRIGSRGQDVKAMNKLRHILRAGVKTRRAIIALTEISVLLERHPGFQRRLHQLEIIDPLALYGHTLADIYLQALPEENEMADDEWL